MKKIDVDVIGVHYVADQNNGVDNQELIEANRIIRGHLIEEVGEELRTAMTDMKKIV